MVKTFGKVIDVLFYSNPAHLGTWEILSAILLFILTWPMELGNTIGGPMWGFFFEAAYVVFMTMFIVRVSET